MDYWHTYTMEYQLEKYPVCVYVCPHAYMQNEDRLISHVSGESQKQMHTYIHSYYNPMYDRSHVHTAHTYKYVIPVCNTDIDIEDTVDIEESSGRVRKTGTVPCVLPRV